MKIQEAVLPDWFQSLTDCDTNTETKQKRAMKSVDRTLTFLDSVLEKQRKSEVRDMRVLKQLNEKMFYFLKLM